jgi:hypothetical protein
MPVARHTYIHTYICSICSIASASIAVQIIMFLLSKKRLVEAAPTAPGERFDFCHYFRQNIFDKIFLTKYF